MEKEKRLMGKEAVFFKKATPEEEKTTIFG